MIMITKHSFADKANAKAAFSKHAHHSINRLFLILYLTVTIQHPHMEN